MVDIDELYRITAEQMERLRQADTYPYSPIYRETDEAVKIKLDKRMSSKELREALSNLPDGDIAIKGVTKQVGRYDEFSRLEILITTHKKIDEVNPFSIKRMLQPIIARQLGLYDWQSPDCKLIALYKEGKITWDECKKAHKAEC